MLVTLQYLITTAFGEHKSGDNKGTNVINSGNSDLFAEYNRSISPKVSKFLFIRISCVTLSPGNYRLHTYL